MQILKDYNINELIDKISKIEIFTGLTIEEIKKIIENSKVVQFPKDSFIIEENSSGNEMYIILKGAVRVLKKTFSDELYTVIDLTEKENAFFGEFALIDSDKRSASILTLNETICLMIEKDEFEKTITENYKIGYFVIRNIAKRIAARLRNANKDIITLFEALQNEIQFED
ncbi:MAG: cyclic nucleotide-binding domain-containing protein [Spirochaetes bacterium]|nr:cyclic nucleotide-binding domain-containing protein [Spirochaetota bacterium]